MVTKRATDFLSQWRDRPRESIKSFNIANAKIAKSLDSLNEGMLKESMAVPEVFRKYPDSFDQISRGTVASSVFLMVDLSPFSSYVSGWEPMDIRDFLHAYYDYVVEIVDKAGGVVEKYIGDAVVAIFGSPFLADTTVDTLFLAFDAAQDIIIRTQRIFDGEVTAKCSISYGSCYLGFVGPSKHSEMTVIGNPLTMLFRLEEHCPAQTIIIERYLFDKIRDRMGTLPTGVARWNEYECRLDLKGVGVVVAVGITYR